MLGALIRAKTNLNGSIKVYHSHRYNTHPCWDYTAKIPTGVEHRSDFPSLYRNQSHKVEYPNLDKHVWDTTVQWAEEGPNWSKIQVQFPLTQINEFGLEELTETRHGLIILAATNTWTDVAAVCIVIPASMMREPRKSVGLRPIPSDRNGEIGKP